MKKKFKVIATATVAVGMMGAMAQGLAQETREDVRMDQVDRGRATLQAGCVNAAQSFARGNLSPQVALQYLRNCNLAPGTEAE